MASAGVDVQFVGNLGLEKTQVVVEGAGSEGIIRRDGGEDGRIVIEGGESARQRVELGTIAPPGQSGGVDENCEV
ncbi:MAG: hypothetical protein ABGZ37_05410, partial [Akkermansiaceae bacterium]